MWCLLRTVGSLEDDGLVWLVEMPYEAGPRECQTAPYILVEGFATVEWDRGTPALVAGLHYSAHAGANTNDLTYEDA
jgi:hypothetical protein